MTKAPIIAAFDIATVTGVCIGRAGGKPEVGSWDMKQAGALRCARLSYFLDLCERFFRERKPDIVRYEGALPLGVAYKIGASEEVLLLLRGAIGVMEAAAWRCGVKDVESFSVHDARKHLTGFRTFPKDMKGHSTAKAEVMKVVKMLGVNVSNFDEADAVAGWFLTCGLHNPRLAHLTSPLFASAKQRRAGGFTVASATP